MSGVLGLLMAFIAYGRIVLKPLSCSAAVILGHAAMRPLAIQSLSAATGTVPATGAYWYMGWGQPPVTGTDETTQYRSSPFCFR